MKVIKYIKESFAEEATVPLNELWIKRGTYIKWMMDVISNKVYQQVDNVCRKKMWMVKRM